MATQKKTPTPYRDKDGFVIYAGDICRSWHEEDPNTAPIGYKGNWLYEQVRFYKGDWYLFEVRFDYDKNDDEPYPLADHYTELEILTSERELVK